MLIILKGRIISTTMRVISLNPITIFQATIIRVGEHMKISPMDIQVCEWNKFQVPIIKKNYGNHLMRSVRSALTLFLVQNIA